MKAQKWVHGPTVTAERVNAYNQLVDTNADLLAALEEMVGTLALDKLQDGCTIESGYDWLFTQARAAIARAKGGA